MELSRRFLMLLAAFILGLKEASTEVNSDSFCQIKKKLDSECASYCYQASKPLLQMAPECHRKDAEIARLKEQLAELKSQLAICAEKEMLYEKQINIAADMATIRANVESISAHLKTLPKKDAVIRQVKLKDKEQTKEILTQNTEDTEESDIESELYSDNCEDSIGIRKIKVSGLTEPFEVFCENTTNDFAWIVAQRRVSRSLDFNKGWANFSNGFGDINGNYFIGLQKIHLLTRTQPYELYIHLESFKGQQGYGRYNNFILGNERENYKLKELGKFTGNIIDALKYNLNAMFSTYDRDNDYNYNGHCARTQENAWWFTRCPSNSNLNGRYADFEVDNSQCIYWKNFSEGHSLKSVKMLIRPAHT